MCLSQLLKFCFSRFKISRFVCTLIVKNNNFTLKCQWKHILTLYSEQNGDSCWFIIYYRDNIESWSLKNKDVISAVYWNINCDFSVLIHAVKIVVTILDCWSWRGCGVGSPGIFWGVRVRVGRKIWRIRSRESGKTILRSWESGKNFLGCRVQI